MESITNKYTAVIIKGCVVGEERGGLATLDTVDKEGLFEEQYLNSDWRDKL